MKTVFAILCTMLLITGPVNAQSQTKSDECDCLKHDLCVKLEQLLSFKDKPDFSINGFETGGPYHKWLLEVQSLCDARSRDKRSSGNHPLPASLQTAPDDLELLAREYQNKSGKSDTKHIRTMLPKLKKTIGYVDYLNAKQKPNKMTMRTWSDSSGTFSVSARFVSMASDTVKLEKAGGVAIQVPINKLSEKDQTYLTELRKNGLLGRAAK